MTMATLSIDRRFCGPPGSGNGGYTAGRLAAMIGDPAEITLRRPPPLETEMRVERAGPRLLLMHGEDLIAEAQKTVVELAIPECPSLHEARSASTGYPGLDRHPFPGCFVCGPQRAADGMAVFPGPPPARPPRAVRCSPPMVSCARTACRRGSGWRRDGWLRQRGALARRPGERT